MTPKLFAFATALALVAGLSACTTATPYQPDPRVTPQADRHGASGGFSEAKLESNRFRVTFTGNSLTPRETVEGYLLFRAAELTLQNGDDWFGIVDRHTDRKDNAYIEPDFFYGGWYGPGFGYWGRGYGRGWGGFGGYGYGGYGWGGWGPYWGGGADIHTTQTYSASAEIITHKGSKPADDPMAFDARAVVENLKPHIQYPPPPK